MTSVGLLIRLYTGWKRDNEQMQKGVAGCWSDYHRRVLVSPRRVNTYYWYYATQLFSMRGESWKRWYGALYPS